MGEPVDRGDGTLVDSDTGEVIGNSSLVSTPSPAAQEAIAQERAAPSLEVLRAVAQERANPSTYAPLVVPTNAEYTPGSYAADSGYGQTATTDTTFSGDAVAVPVPGVPQGGFAEQGTLSDANALPPGEVGYDPTQHAAPVNLGGQIAPAAAGGGKGPANNMQSTWQDPYQQDTQAGQQELIRQHRDAAMADFIAKFEDAQLAGDEYDNVVKALGAEDVFKMQSDVQRMYNDNMDKLADVDQRFLTLAGKSVDPGRIYANGGAATVAMSAAVGALSQALLGPGAPNTALNIINNAIDRDIRAQEVNLQNEGNSLRGSLSTLAQINSVIGDKQIALAKTREILRADIIARTNARTAKTGSELVLNNAKALAQANEVELMKSRDSMAGLVNKHTLSQYARGPAAAIANAEKLRQANAVGAQQAVQPVAPAPWTSQQQEPQAAEAPPQAPGAPAQAQAPAVAPARPATRPTNMPKQTAAAAPKGSHANGPAGPMPIQNVGGKEVAVEQDRYGNTFTHPVITKADGTKVAVVALSERVGITNPDVWRRTVKKDADLADARDHADRGLGKAERELEAAPDNYNKLVKLRAAMREFYKENKDSLGKINSSVGGLNPAAYKFKQIIAPLIVTATLDFKTESGGDSRMSEGEYKILTEAANLGGVDDLFLRPERMKQLLDTMEPMPGKFLTKIERQGAQYGIGFNPGQKPGDAARDDSSDKFINRTLKAGGGK